MARIHLRTITRPGAIARRAIMACSLVLSAIGCHEQRFGARPTPADGEELPILDQYQGTHSHEVRAMQLVIRDPTTLAQVPLVDLPVNFNEEMLLIVTLGQVTSEQYAVRIDRVWREGGQLRVSIQEQAPDKPTTIKMASPYCVAIVPKCDLNVAGFLTTPPKRERSWEESPPPKDLGGGAKTPKAPKVTR